MYLIRAEIVLRASLTNCYTFSDVNRIRTRASLAPLLTVSLVNHILKKEEKNLF
jgi:hypothetical protein